MFDWIFFKLVENIYDVEKWIYIARYFREKIKCEEKREIFFN